MTEWLIYAGLGAFAGVLAGLFGVGGGLVIVPVLAVVFHQAGVEAGVIMQLAVGTSLATIVFTSLSSVRAHHRRGAVGWSQVAQLLPGIVLGAWLGAVLADQLRSDTLKALFGVFELLVALQMGLNLRPAPHRELPGRWGMGLAGGVIGGVSALVGIGGGTMTVPFLQWCNVPMRQAVATSAACGLPIALAGAAGFVISGWDNARLPPLSSGYLYWPAFAGIVVASVLFAPLGARLAHALPAATLKRFFALFLALLGGYMLFGQGG
ncbi:MAG: sulfite exporter TauE/SafE family protein [Pseudomonadota bacterium]